MYDQGCLLRDWFRLAAYCSCPAKHYPLRSCLMRFEVCSCPLSGLLRWRRSGAGRTRRAGFTTSSTKTNKRRKRRKTWSPSTDMTSESIPTTKWNHLQVTDREWLVLYLSLDMKIVQCMSAWPQVVFFQSLLTSCATSRCFTRDMSACWSIVRPPLAANMPMVFGCRLDFFALALKNQSVRHALEI